LINKDKGHESPAKKNRKAVYRMLGEISFFRKRFLGGFNRQDVVDYISKLAKERNEFRDAKDKAVQDARALASEVASLRQELDTARRTANEYKVEALETAVKTFTELESTFLSMLAEVETATAGVCTEIERTTSGISAEIERTTTGICAELERAKTGICAELVAASGAVAGVPAKLERAGEMFAELREALAAEKEAADTAGGMLEKDDAEVDSLEDDDTGDIASEADDGVDALKAEEGTNPESE
jgi:chromosome segregation ATPase